MQVTQWKFGEPEALAQTLWFTLFKFQASFTV